MNATISPRDVRRDRGVRRPCPICGEPTREPIAFGMVRPSLSSRLLASYPKLTADNLICRKHLTEQRTRYVEDLLARERGEISELERQVVASLAREETVARDTEIAWAGRRTLGERVADFVADFGGSWNFIISFFFVLLAWIGFNLRGAQLFDPYPFILLNLVLSGLHPVPKTPS